MRIQVIKGKVILTEVSEKDISRSGVFHFPPEVTEITYSTFHKLEYLTHTKIPDAVERIFNCTFQNCTRLQSVSLSKNLIEIEWQAFSNCSSLKHIEIPSKVRKIGQGAFSRCTELQSVTLPVDLIEIAPGAFSDTSLRHIVIPKKVSTIGAWAFSGCAALTTVILPKSLINIGCDPFTGCSALKFILIDTTSKEEFERIKDLLPEETKKNRFIFSKEMWEVMAPIQENILEKFCFRNRSFNVLRDKNERFLWADILDKISTFEESTHLAFNQILTEINQLDPFTILRSESEFNKKEFSADYKEKLDSILEKHKPETNQEFDKYTRTLLSELESYKNIIISTVEEKAPPSDCFFSNSRPLKNIEIWNTYHLIQKIIDLIKNKKPLLLSVDEITQIQKKESLWSILESQIDVISNNHPHAIS